MTLHFPEQKIIALDKIVKGTRPSNDVAFENI